MSGRAADTAGNPPALSFDAIAGDYDAARPGYPAALFEALIDASPPRRPLRILEVGCGTGIATEGLARPESEVVAIDPGPNMLAQARRRLAEGPGLAFVHSSFEAFAPDPASRFELIVSAQAWHWVDPQLGYAKAARMLSPGGVLALAGNVEADPTGELARAFQAVFGDSPWSLARSGYGVDGFIPRDLAGSGFFADLRHLHYRRPVRWSAEAYAAMVATHSSVQALGAAVRERLLDALREAILRQGGELESEIETHAWLGVNASGPAAPPPG
ncbi:MAG TPA: methyltransferase domain-containing protein [Caulobacteraceae bacterium]|jgi:SAM-dependent methyltransferase|nr:methyltransferase domain-containing protein [Caulobacteraceae bacterium]